jgi:hypothetical protein
MHSVRVLRGDHCSPALDGRNALARTSRGIVRRRHHSQARDSPWTMFFNGVKRHQKRRGWHLQPPRQRTNCCAIYGPGSCRARLRSARARSSNGLGLSWIPPGLSRDRLYRDAPLQSYDSLQHFHDALRPLYVLRSACKSPHQCAQQLNNESTTQFHKRRTQTAIHEGRIALLLSGSSCRSKADCAISTSLVGCFSPTRSFTRNSWSCRGHAVKRGCASLTDEHSLSTRRHARCD